MHAGLTLASLLWVAPGRAQDPGDSSDPGTGPNPPPPSLYTPPDPGPPSTTVPTTNPATNPANVAPEPTNGGSTDVFAPAPVSGTFPASTETPATNAATLPDNLSAPAVSTDAAPPVTVNGAYGSSPIVLQPRAGRFAQKPLKFSLSTSLGFDDNVFSASDEQPPGTPFIPGTPEQKITSQRFIAAVPARPAQILPGGIIIPAQPAQPAHTETTVIGTIPATPDQPAQPANDGPQSSLVSSVNAQGSLNFATPRTLFSLQLSLGTQYYFSRPGKKNDYNGSVNLVLSHRVTPRLRANVLLNSVYQNTPDFSRLNVATRDSTGAYYDTNFRLDLEYQWSSRFSTVTSYSFNGTYFVENNQTGRNVTQNILGNDFRFTLSPRTTLVTSLRASADTHEDSLSDTTSVFLLGGADFALSRRLTTTARAGAQVQSYKNGSGQTTTSPYIEGTLSYAYTRGSTVNWTNRYGLEPATLGTREASSYITSINVNHVLSARTSLGVGLNFTRRSSEFDDQARDSLAENYLSANVGLEYIYTANWSFTARYEYFKLISNASFADYARNRFTIGAEYDF